jgi:Na+/H+ antiporter NhaD/arsenite permease-like protein
LAAFSISRAEESHAAGAEAPAEHAEAHCTAGEHHAEADHKPIGETLPLWSILPFIGILLSIAIWPLANAHFWEHNMGKISAFWALGFAVPFTAAYGFSASLYEILHIYIIDYIPFIILLFGLFVASGGIIVRGTLKGTPLINCMFILIGTVLSSWIGTTGSSMLLIRPLIRANAGRKYKAHVIIFFIFLVSNIGGGLTPVGDPPLFLGFLHGVPFFWTMKCLKPILMVSAILLVLFYIIDTLLVKREGAQSLSDAKDPIRVGGTYNFLFLFGIVGAVIFSGVFNHHPLFYDAGAGHARGITIMGGGHPLILASINLCRDLFILLMAFLSYKLTPLGLRKDNNFTFWPIQEVAILFAGIFMCIVPALAILKAGENGALSFIIAAVNSPKAYFWITGSLSSFLDNAPTYLTFLNTALGSFYPGMAEPQAVAKLVVEQVPTLLAISCGAVFMGANTYIGNAPNFMVRSIAIENKIPMPSFFGYMGWSIVILVPAFFLTTLVFF